MQSHYKFCPLSQLKGSFVQPPPVFCWGFGEWKLIFFQIFKLIMVATLCAHDPSESIGESSVLIRRHYPPLMKKINKQLITKTKKCVDSSLSHSKTRSDAPTIINISLVDYYYGHYLVNYHLTRIRPSLWSWTDMF
jgi:hypothetical protein